MAEGRGSTAIGYEAMTSSDYAVAIGSAEARGDYSVAMGGARTEGLYSTAMGSAFAEGDYATAMGDSEARGYYATAMGASQASGFYSTAMGTGWAARSYSTAMGERTTADGSTSTAMGLSTEARGAASTSMGYYTIAPSFAETAIGGFNTSYTPNNATGWNASDRLFVIGNGNDNARSDALVMLKNGNTTLKGELTLTNGSSSYTLPNTDGQANQVLATNGAGTLAWSTPATTNSSVATATGDYTVLSSDNYIIYTGASTGTITLPTAVGASGKEYIIKNMTAYGVTIATTSSEEIWQDANNKTVTVSLGVETQNNWIKVVSDGTQWISFRALY
jgi:hypothetical protein